MKTKLDTDWVFIKDWSKNELKVAQKNFLKNSTAQNWAEGLNAMLVWQQLDYVERSVIPATRAKQKDIIRILDIPRLQWAERIIMTILGMTIEQTLRGQG